MLKNNLEEFINTNIDKFDKNTPPSFVLDNILNKMQAKKKPEQTGVFIRFTMIRRLAACVALIALSVVYLTLNKEIPDSHISERKSPSTVKLKRSLLNKSMKKYTNNLDVQILKSKKVLITNLQNRKGGQEEPQIVNLQNKSTAYRLSTVSHYRDIATADSEIIDALILTLNSDSNSNVRLTALDGLARFYHESSVRQRIVDALEKQDDPVVQIAMINRLVRLRELDILKQLNQIINDIHTEKAVKDCAYSGISRLQSL